MAEVEWLGRWLVEWPRFRLLLAPQSGRGSAIRAWRRACVAPRRHHRIRPAARLNQRACHSGGGETARARTIPPTAHRRTRAGPHIEEVRSHSDGPFIGNDQADGDLSGSSPLFSPFPLWRPLRCCFPPPHLQRCKRRRVLSCFRICLTEVSRRSPGAQVSRASILTEYRGFGGAE